MYAGMRIALVLAALGLAATPLWLAYRIVSDNLAVMSSWRRSEGEVRSLAADDCVELEVADARVNAPIAHKLGLSFLKQIPIYIDPGDSSRVRTGGLLQMWLWPAGLILAVVMFVGASVGAAVVRQGMFSPPPPQLETEIRVHLPSSEWKAPLFWSLLGAAALAIGVLSRSAGHIQRMSLSYVGVLFMLAMWVLAADTKTTEISADRHVLRKTSALGWREIRWEQVGSVAQEHTIFGRGQSILRTRDRSFPARDVTTIVFRSRSGRRLLSMSPNMQPEKLMVRLLDTCAERTGLRLEFRTNYAPNL